MKTTGLATETATAHLHLRVKPSQKQKYIQQAKRNGKPLTVWILNAINKAAK